MSAEACSTLLLACVLWAVSFIATKKALVSTPPLTVVALRLIQSAGCFVVWLAATRRHLPLAALRESAWGLMLLSLSGGGLHMGFRP
jgi:drug/metabolite transporter (DMT)-like permease